MNKLKSILLVFLLFFMCYSGFAQGYVNFAEALQKSLYFYDANMCNLETPNRLEWRAECHMRDLEMPLDTDSTNMSASFIQANRAVLDPDGNGTMDLSGGYHDAGDHVKFGLPQGYSASTLGWGLYEFKQAFIDVGAYDHMLDVLKYFTDYFLRVTFKNSAGEVVAFAYQVGDGPADHVCWCPPELWYELSTTNLRPASFGTSETPASDMAGEMAASLTTMYFNYRDTDAAYAQECLDTAMALYAFGKAHRGLGESGGFYGSHDDADDLSWAATWLYEATGDMGYIDDIMSIDGTGHYTGYLSDIVDTPDNDWNNAWVHCWDTVWGGAWTRMAVLFPENELYDYYSRWNIEYWSGGEVPHKTSGDSNYLNYTPAGYGMINTWGSARYNAAAQLCALSYAKHKDRPDMAQWAKGQMTYLMGDNPLNRSYIVGYSDNYAKHPHHRAAHGSLKNAMDIPAEHKHTLWGALVGGPDGSDEHKDITDDFAYNEVAIDYNAAFVGACAGLYEFFGRAEGHQPVADFPPKESIQEYSIEARVEEENQMGVQLKLKLYIETALPPRLESGLEARYYFNIRELLDAGKSISDIKSMIYYDEQGILHGGPNAILGPPVAVDAAAGEYYMPIDWNEARMIGTREIQFVIQINQDYSPGANNPAWDGSNDPSRKGLGFDYAVTNVIPVFKDGYQVYPPVDGPTPTPETPTATPYVDYLFGDVDDSGAVDIVDALLVAQYYVGLIQNLNALMADVNCDGVVDIVDAMLIAQYYVGVISQLGC